MNRSDQSTQCSDYINIIATELSELGLVELNLTYYGKFYTHPSIPTIKKIADKIKELKNQVIMTGFEKIDEMISDEVIFIFAIARQDKIDLLYNRANEKNLDKQPSSYISSHEVNVDELHRINREIRTKQNQFSPDKTNVLVLQTDLFLKSEFDEIKKTIIQLQQHIHGFEKMLLCVITG